ncbi:MAG TPA: SusC/RagA family TonB-linked outer membrane protein [Chitinophagaceae bacterium]|nr:SusC/RagA family TonB-linked outer membrane protein [Chitinophagaceae bacterium]
MVAVSAYGQATVSLSEKNTDLSKVLKKIKQQTGYSYFGPAPLLRTAQKVTIDVKDGQLIDVLDRIFQSQPFTYMLVGTTIVLKERERDDPKKPVSSQAPSGNLDISGSVVNEKGEPADRVSVNIKGTKRTTVTDANGEFLFKKVPVDAVLVFTSVNTQPHEVNVNGQANLAVNLKTQVDALQDVTLTFNTGYQTMKANEATGSVVVVTKEQLDQRVATNIIDKLEGITNGLVFNKDALTGENKLRIRGESTINGYQSPLIVVDGFPYDGDINNINPNDVENIYVLKDAAAASIWGVQAGNGVIVITTRRGKLNQPARYEFSANFTIADKPDLFYAPRMAPSEWIDLEIDLFQRGNYNAALNDVNKRAVSPVVEILNSRKLGQISAADSSSMINALRSNDLRNEMLEHLYRKQFNQQYQFNISGGNNRMSYYFSTGYDRRQSNIVGNNDSRMTLNSQTTYLLFKGMELRAGLSYTESNGVTNGISNIPNSQPYMRLIGDNGLELAIPQHRQMFEDTISNRGFPDWKYYPLQEKKNNDRTSRSHNTRLLTGLKYSILRGLNLDFSYQYNRTFTRQRRLTGANSYFVRDRMNTFAILNNGLYAGSNFPAGALLDIDNSDLVSHYGRLSLQYNRAWIAHAIAAIAGIDVRETRTEGSGNQLYGYSEENGTFATPNLFTQYPTYPSGSARTLDALANGVYSTGTINRFRTYFTNIAYTLKQRYTVSTSVRFDGTNYFGVKTNDKTLPLWSTGAKWDISKESFYRFKLLPTLSLRVTYGYQGNLDQNRSAYATIRMYSGAGFTGLPYAAIVNIPNPELRWEKTGQLNFALDFATAKNRISGSLQYFRKKGKDLIGEELIDPTTGVTILFGNFSQMRTDGADIALTIKNIDRELDWNTTINFNYATDKIIRYTGPVGGHVTAFSFPVPIVGKPLYSLFSYRWAGLDPSDGGPRIYVADTINKRYSSSGAIKVSDLEYSGRYNPPITGSVINHFRWKGISLGFNIMYKLGHYFRRSSVNYSALIGTGWPASHSDYSLRWRQPGDEVHTNVPSIAYTGSLSRDDYYRFSNVLVEKADHIRLQFVNLSYSFPKQMLRSFSFQALQVYFYANNLGILWRASDQDIDPDYPYMPYPPQRSYSFGIKAGF